MGGMSKDTRNHLFVGGPADIHYSFVTVTWYTCSIGHTYVVHALYTCYTCVIHVLNTLQDTRG